MVVDVRDDMAELLDFRELAQFHGAFSFDGRALYHTIRFESNCPNGTEKASRTRAFIWYNVITKSVNPEWHAGLPSNPPRSPALT
jgi:hypothetical protein